MNRTEIGRALGTDALEERRVVTQRFWNEWAAKFPHLPERRQQELMAQLYLLESQAIGNAVITYAPGWKEIDFDPSADGLDLPEPSIVTQKDTGGTYVTTWWKIGPTKYDWTNFGSGGGGGGLTTGFGFKTAAAVNFRKEDFRALYSEEPPPHYWTIGGKVFKVQNQIAYAPTGGIPWLTGPGSPGGRDGALRWPDNTWTVYPIVQSRLVDLGVPDLSKIAEVWMFLEFTPPAGDASLFQKLILGLSSEPNIYGNADLQFRITKTSNNNTTTTTTQGLMLSSATTGGNTPSRLDDHTVIAMRLLPECVEVYSGVPASMGDPYLCESKFTVLRGLMKRLGVLLPTNTDRGASLAAAWADGNSPTLFVTSLANRVGEDGPAFRALRVDYLESGLIGAGSIDVPSQAFEEVTSSSGIAALSDTKRSVKLSGTEDLLGLSTFGLAEGAEEAVYFVQGRVVKHGASVGPGYAPFAMEAGQDFEVTAKSLFRFKLVDDAGLVWRHIGGSRA